MWPQSRVPVYYACMSLGIAVQEMSINEMDVGSAARDRVVTARTEARVAFRTL